MSERGVYALAYVSPRNLLYAGTGWYKGVFRYNGTSWIDTGGGMNAYTFFSLAFDAGANRL